MSFPQGNDWLPQALQREDIATVRERNRAASALAEVARLTEQRDLYKAALERIANPKHTVMQTEEATLLLAEVTQIALTALAPEGTAP